tara:strand:- start:33503 stop:38008 length:4506 start_codon:yes stop_codon:yes gene_type:complete
MATITRPAEGNGKTEAQLTEARSKCITACGKAPVRPAGFASGTALKKWQDERDAYSKCVAACEKKHGNKEGIEIQGIINKAMGDIAPELAKATETIVECAREYLEQKDRLRQLMAEFYGNVPDTEYKMLTGPVQGVIFHSDQTNAFLTPAKANWYLQNIERTALKSSGTGVSSGADAYASPPMPVGGISPTAYASLKANWIFAGGGQGNFEASSDYTKFIDDNQSSTAPLVLQWDGWNPGHASFITDPKQIAQLAAKGEDGAKEGTSTMNMGPLLIPGDKKVFNAGLVASEQVLDTKTWLVSVGGVGKILTQAELDSWPFGWASWFLSLAAEANLLSDIGPTQEDVDRLASTVTYGYTDVTQKNHGDAKNDQNSPYDAAFFSSPLGILSYGSPRFWAANSQNLIYKSQIAAGAGSATRMREATSITVGTTTTSYEPGSTSPDLTPATQQGLNLQNQNLAWMASYLEGLADQLTKTGAPGADAAGTYMVTFGGLLTDITNQMLDKATCIFNADWEADEAVNKAVDAMEKEKTGGFFATVFGNAAQRNKMIEDAIRDIRKKAAAGAPLMLGAEPERLLFKEQCFLLSFIGLISDYKKRTLNFGEYSQAEWDQWGADSTPATAGHGHPAGNHKRLPYHISYNHATGALGTKKTNATLLVDGDPYGFVNKLTVSPYTTRLLNIENWELSNLQPRIRLFKVVYDGSEEKEIEIKFDSHFSKGELELFLDKNSRGGGIGLKSFNFTYDGSNPFAAKKSIKGQLNLFANSFNELLRIRKGKDEEGKMHDYKYVELALKTGKPYKDKNCDPDHMKDYLALVQENEELSKLNFRLKAVVGWSAPHGLSGLRQDDKIALQRALDDSFVTLNLTPTVHNFDFDEQGRVNFTINYLAYIEDFFDQKGYNIFADPTGEIGIRRIKRALTLKHYQRECGGSSPSVPVTTDPSDSKGASKEETLSPADSLAKIKATYAEEVKIDTLASVSKLLYSMACTNSIYYINIPYQKMKDFVQLGPFKHYEDYHKAYNEGNFIMNNESYGSQLATGIDNALNNSTSGMAGYLKTGESLSGQRNVKRQVAAALVAVNPNENNLGFFYVSDLLDQILGNIDLELDALINLLKGKGPAMKWSKDSTQCEIDMRINELKLYKKNFKRFRILLGPVEFVHHKVRDGKPSAFVNFGDIPISVKYFVEWLTSKVLQRDETSYPLTKFLNDFFNTLVRDFLNDDSCFIYNTSQKVRVNQAVLTSFRPEDPFGEHDEITHHIITKFKDAGSRINVSHFKHAEKWDASARLCNTNVQKDADSDLPILNVAGIKGSAQTYAPLSREMNYFVFFAGRTMPTELMNGIKCQDEDRAIQHYLMGRDKGLIKNIKLTKTDSTGLAEVRFEQDGYDGLRQLRVVYDVEIDSFANVQVYPGTYIYIPPRGFDPALISSATGVDFDLTDLGIGGYYMVIRSEHEFGEGYANSKIHAKWVAQVDKGATPSNTNAVGTRASPGKCGMYANREWIARGQKEKP